MVEGEVAASAEVTLPPAREVFSLRLAHAGMQRLLSEDRWVVWCTLIAACAQLCVIGWDQPSVLGWENDGVAPRDFFRGVFENLQPGHGHRYPLLHNLLLFVASLPVLAVAALWGPLSSSAIQARVTSLPTMTALSLLIKTLHIACGVLLVLMLARIARRSFDRDAGRATALLAISSVTLSYYSRSSNLDGPYMMWTALAIDRLLSVLERGSARDYALLGVFAAASVATKDQAYAAYVLTIPLYLVLLPLVRPTLLARGDHFRALLATASYGALSYAAFSGAIVNPTGLVTRIRMLTGTNSQDWRNYARGARGLWLNVRDLWQAQSSFFWGKPLVYLGWLAALFAPWRAVSSRRRVARSVPLVAALSSVLTFTLPVARCEHRFLLPLGAWLCIYAGAGLAALWQRLPIAGLRYALVSALLLPNVLGALALPLTQWCDARRDLEQRLAALPASSVVETYGFNVYFPRFDLRPDANYVVHRVGKEPANKRARLQHMDEIVDDFGNVEARAPNVLVIPEGFAWRFLPRTFREGEAPSAQWLAAQRDEDATRFFRAAIAGRLPGYRTAELHVELPSWASFMQPISIHDLSTAQRVWWLERINTRGNTSAH